MSVSADDHRARFRRLHEQGCFVIPNPWDRGTAIALAATGFPALATTSAGCAFALGRPDTPTALGIDEVLGNIAEIVDAVELPVNADFQAGYAEDLAGLAENVRRCVATGVAGLSIEDALGGGANPLLPLPEAVERVRVARSAIDQSGADVLLTARAECFLYGHPDPLTEAITRLRAFADAGADVLYAPGVRTREDIEELGDGVRPLPLNVLMSSDTGLTVRDLAELEVRRISVGSFAGLAAAAPFGELNALFEPPQNR